MYKDSLLTQKGDKILKLQNLSRIPKLLNSKFSEKIIKQNQSSFKEFLSYDYSDVNSNFQNNNAFTLKNKMLKRKIGKEFCKRKNSNLSRNNAEQKVSGKYVSAENSPKFTTRVKIASTLGGYSKGVSLCVSRKSSLNM